MTMSQSAFCWNSGYAAYHFHLILYGSSFFALRYQTQLLCSDSACVPFIKMFFEENHLILCFAEGQPSMWNSNTREKPTNMCRRPTHPPPSAVKAQRNQKKPDHYLHCAFSKCKKSVQLIGLSMGRISFFRTFLPHNKLIFIEAGS